VRTHPENGRKALFLNPVRMESIVGMEDTEALNPQDGNEKSYEVSDSGLDNPTACPGWRGSSPSKSRPRLVGLSTPEALRTRPFGFAVSQPNASVHA
jgi:hypothetical protein